MRPDAGDEKFVRSSIIKSDLAREREVEELRQMLEIRMCRAFVWRLLIKCGYLHAPVTHELETFRQIGQKDIELWIVNEVLTASPETLMVMWQEAKELKLEGAGEE